MKKCLIIKFQNRQTGPTWYRYGTSIKVNNKETVAYSVHRFCIMDPLMFTIIWISEVLVQYLYGDYLLVILLYLQSTRDYP